MFVGILVPGTYFSIELLLEVVVKSWVVSKYTQYSKLYQYLSSSNFGELTLKCQRRVAARVKRSGHSRTYDGGSG